MGIKHHGSRDDRCTVSREGIKSEDDSAQNNELENHEG